MSPLGTLQLRLLNEFDMAGFSLHGVGASAQLHCAIHELARFEGVLFAGALTALDWANGHDNDRKKVEACRKNPLTQCIHSRPPACLRM